MKTITLDDEAYEILVAQKVDDRDSFSRVVKRRQNSGRIRSSAGLWADMADEEVAARRRETVRASRLGRRRR